MTGRSPGYIYRALVTLAAVLLMTASAGSVNFETEDNIHITNLHRIDDDLFAWGSSVTVDGIIEGDLIAGAWTAYTNGHIRGSANVFAYQYHHTGNVDGALRAFAATCRVDGYTGRSALIAGSDVNIGEKANIEKDVILRGETIHFDGMAKENVDIEGTNVFIGGIIGGDAVIKGAAISITAPAVIKGNLTYITDTKEHLEIGSGVTIMGEKIWKKRDEAEGGKRQVSFWATIVLHISKILAAFLFGVILLFLFRNYAIEAVNQLKTRTTVATAAGFLSMVIFAISILILLVAIAFVLLGLALVDEGSPAGALVLAVSILMVPITSFLTVSGGVLFYSGKIIAALVVGFLISGLLKKGPAVISRTQLLMGLVLLTLIFAIPYVGFLLYVITSIIGAGAIVLGVKYCRKEMTVGSQPLETTTENNL